MQGRRKKRKVGQRTNVRGKADGEANLEVGKSIAGQQGWFDQALGKRRPVSRHGPPARAVAG